MLPASVRIFVCTVPRDMRRSFDSLALVTLQLLGENPQSGSLYVFLGKRPTRVKVLWFDKMDTACKRLEDGRLPLHNNFSERELRREALGRRNWISSAATTAGK
jgi:transposase